MKRLYRRRRASPPKQPSEVTTTSATNSRKSVTFDDSEEFVTIHEVDKLYTPDQKEEIWYNRSDELYFQDRDDKLICLLDSMPKSMADMIAEGDEESTRGLEYAIGDNAGVFDMLRSNALLAVIMMQDHCRFQQKKKNDSKRSSDKSSESMIAKVYASSCGKAMEDAHSLALEDAQFVAENIQLPNNQTLPDKHGSPVALVRPSILVKKNSACKRTSQNRTV